MAPSDKGLFLQKLKPPAGFHQLISAEGAVSLKAMGDTQARIKTELAFHSYRHAEGDRQTSEEISEQSNSK